MYDSMRRKMKILFALAAFAGVHCGNAGLYDEAITNYARVVRSGLNEWYPLNGNLVSRIGSATGTATAAYSAGTNRSGESGKAVCTTSSRLDFSPTTFGAAPFTVSAWVKFNSLGAGPNSILHRGHQQTGWCGFQFSQTGSVSAPLVYGDCSFSTSSTGAGFSAGAWYYLSFAYANGAGNFYIGKYESSLTTYGPLTGNYSHDTTVLLQVFLSPVDACVDDLLHYNRALSVDEIKQNFQTLE